MERFAFVIHPLQVGDFARKFPFTRWLPARWVEAAFRHVPPLLVSHITGIRSEAGPEAEGWFIGLPMTPRVMLESDPEFVYGRLARCAEMAQRLGARILGLGAFTKIVGDRGVTVARRSPIPVTTGNSYTAATAVEGALAAARRLDIAPARARAAVVGATGAIGAACARLLARQVGSLALVARGWERLERLADQIRAESKCAVEATDRVREAVRDADIVLTVTSATTVLVEPEDLKPGAVVCDVARPRNVSREVYARRDDVLVLDGGVIQVPGEVDFGFDFGFPPGTCEACMAETIALALEGRYESYTLGPELSLERVEEIARIAHRHGFRLAGFRRFERAIGEEEVERIRRRRHAAVPPPV
ncbi:MAG: shikimate dehydrogenase [Armatimonadota bacterium]|nr:shikimate dehydrogenase [Armatimonadota bacterium]MDW8155158.1 shikimate dehydrogenase [Armatimonadota bacterium]